MSIKFSQLPKTTTIASTSLIPIVDVGTYSNVLYTTTGATLTSFVNSTTQANASALQTQINSLSSNAASQQTNINTLISGQNTMLSTISAMQGQITTLQNSDSSDEANIADLQGGLTAANAAIITANTAMKSYVDAQNTVITTAWSANAATQHATLATKAPLASPTFTGTVTLTASATVAGLTSNAAIVPSANASINLGSTSAWWNNIYGTAIHAQYADLAENFLADADYEIGTVVMIGGTAEVTACQFGSRAVGVVSAEPSYLMNSKLEGGVAIALKGRVPVKVVGTVVKGQDLIASADGCAIAGTLHTSDKAFAVAIESSTDTGVKLVEALVL